MLTREPYGGILEGFVGLDHRLTLPSKGRSGREMINSLIKVGYDTVIDLQNHVKSRMLTASLRAPRVIRFRRSRVRRWLRIKFPLLRERLSPSPEVPVGYLQAAQTLGVTDDGAGLKLEVVPEWERDARELLQRGSPEPGLNNTQPALVIAPGSRHPTKIWPPERWAEFLKGAYGLGYRNQVILGDANDLGLADRIKSEFRHPVISLAGQTDLGQLVGLIARAGVLIASDSAPVHIAAAVGTPVVAIFGPTTPDLGFAPFRCKSRIAQIDDLECRPCHPHGSKRCPRGHFKCMKNLTATAVLNQLQEIAPVWSKAGTAAVATEY